MTNTTSTTNAITTAYLPPNWQHIDQIFPEVGDDLLTMAADTVESVRDSLLGGQDIRPDVLARMLDVAARHIRTASAHLENAILTQE